jgi:hypothetical protein
MLPWPHHQLLLLLAGCCLQAQLLPLHPLLALLLHLLLRLPLQLLLIDLPSWF